MNTIYYPMEIFTSGLESITETLFTRDFLC